MLSRFKVGNFLSIEEELELSFNHSVNNADVFQNNIIFEYKDNNRKRALLNGVLILGANASGKSNILIAMRKMRDYYLSSFKFDKAEDITCIIHPFYFTNKINPVTEFKIEFIELGKENLIINYCFSFDSSTDAICSESLSYRKILKTTVSEEFTVFKRDQDTITHYSKEIETIIKKIAQENIIHKLVLSLMIFDINKTFFKDEINSLPFNIVLACGQFLDEKLIFSNDKDEFNPFVEKINSDPNFKKYIIRSLYDFDFALTDFWIEDITEDLISVLNSSNLLDNFTDEIKKNVLSNTNKIKQYRIETIHKLNNEDYSLSINAESAGTKKFLRNSLKIYNSLLNERIYISDEFDSHYHLRLQEGIIDNYISYEFNKNKKKSQFLIVTHNPLLLNKTFFAKEQIYFIEKDREKQNTFVYSLKDFKDISYNNHNWSQLYISGRLGAVPEVIY